MLATPVIRRIQPITTVVVEMPAMINARFP